MHTLLKARSTLTAINGPIADVTPTRRPPLALLELVTGKKAGVPSETIANTVLKNRSPVKVDFTDLPALGPLKVNCLGEFAIGRESRMAGLNCQYPT
jgi:hypothetical protein